MMQPSRLLGRICRPTSLIGKREASTPAHSRVHMGVSAAADGPQWKSEITDQHLEYFRATDVQFCPTRAREVIQNAVAETSTNGGSGIEDPFTQHSNEPHNENGDDEKYFEVYRNNGSISLNAVMQSNVPQPFTIRGKAPTHLNMPGGAWGQGYKYISGQQHRTHQAMQPISLPWSSR